MLPDDRYNLKRKVAGLPPVTREWYDARKSQLLGSLDTSVKRTWQDPLTGKKFGSENTYEAFTRWVWGLDERAISMH